MTYPEVQVPTVCTCSVRKNQICYHRMQPFDLLTSVNPYYTQNFHSASQPQSIMKVGFTHPLYHITTKASLQHLHHIPRDRRASTGDQLNASSEKGSDLHEPPKFSSVSLPELHCAETGEHACLAEYQRVVYPMRYLAGLSIMIDLGIDRSRQQ